MSAPSEGTLLVSTETLRAILAEFKLELVEEFAKKASQSMVDELDRRLIVIELWKERQEGGREQRQEISGKWLAIAGVLSALIGSIATLIWLHAGA